MAEEKAAHDAEKQRLQLATQMSEEKAVHDAEKLRLQAQLAALQTGSAAGSGAQRKVHNGSQRQCCEANDRRPGPGGGHRGIDPALSIAPVPTRFSVKEVSPT